MIYIYIFLLVWVTKYLSIKLYWCKPKCFTAQQAINVKTMNTINKIKAQLPESTDTHASCWSLWTTPPVCGLDFVDGPLVRKQPVRRFKSCSCSCSSCFLRGVSTQTSRALMPRCFGHYGSIHCSPHTSAVMWSHCVAEDHRGLKPKPNVLPALGAARFHSALCSSTPFSLSKTEQIKNKTTTLELWKWKRAVRLSAEQYFRIPKVASLGWTPAKLWGPGRQWTALVKNWSDLSVTWSFITCRSHFNH